VVVSSEDVSRSGRGKGGHTVLEIRFREDQIYNTSPSAQGANTKDAPGDMKGRGGCVGFCGVVWGSETKNFADGRQ